MTIPRLEQAMELSPRLEMQQFIDVEAEAAIDREEAAEDLIRKIVLHVRENFDDAVRELETGLRTNIKRSPASAHSFERYLVEQVIQFHGREFFELDQQKGASSDIREKIRQTVRTNIARLGRHYLQRQKFTTPVQSESQRNMITTYGVIAEDALKDTEANRIVMNATMEDFSLRDMAEYRLLYNERLISIDQARMAAAGKLAALQKSIKGGVFIGDFSEAEEPMTSQLLSNRNFYAGEADPAKRYGHETLVGKTLRHHQTNELLALALFGAAPFHPEQEEERTYLNEMEAYLDHGVSNGQMTYETGEERNALLEKLRKGQVARLIMIIGKTRNGVYRVLYEAMRELLELPRPPETVLSYYLSGLKARLERNVQGKDRSYTGPLLKVNNLASAVSLRRVGFDTLAMESIDNSKPMKVLKVSDDTTISLTPRWQHVEADAAEVKRSSKAAFTKTRK